MKHTLKAEPIEEIKTEEVVEMTEAEKRYRQVMLQRQMQSIEKKLEKGHR
jgi:hypothetical protein